VPAPQHLQQYYQRMKKYSFRLFLRDVIKYQEGFSTQQVVHYATAEVTKEYIGYLLQLGLLEPHQGGYRLRKRPIKSFGETLEWFLAETLKREFAAEALWGVKFRRPRIGGDYDLVAKVDASILYMEVKSSPPKQIYQSEIRAFLKRVEDLAPEVAVFFMDTELRMKDKIVPMFQEEGLRPQRLYKELFHAPDRIYIINAKGSVAANVQRVLSHALRRKD